MNRNHRNFKLQEIEKPDCGNVKFGRIRKSDHGNVRFGRTRKSDHGNFMLRRILKSDRGKFQLRRIIKNWLILLGIFAGAVGICFFYGFHGAAEGNGAYASPVFVLAVLLVSRFTDGYIYGLTASVLGVICVNFFFTYPYMAVNFSIAGYPLTFLTLLIVSLITGTLTTRAKQRDLLKMENEREKIRADLLRSISHDLRTPLTSIIGSTAVVLEDGNLSKEEDVELLTDVKDEAEWLLRLVENLLMVTKIDQSQEIRKESWAVEEVIGEAIAKLQKAYPQLLIEVSIPDKPLFVPMDPILIEQVLFNLGENAALHGETACVVKISAIEQDGMAGFLVQDDGRGFPEEMLQAFQDGKIRTEAGSDSNGKRNMGLGLRVCSAIVKAHNGKMSLQNSGSGAEVSFFLPME